MRNEIDNARKNYYGKFEQEKDTETDLENLWVPLTEWSVEGMVKNVDLDTKDINIKSPEAKYNSVANILKLVIFNFLKKINFGEILNDVLRRLCIDGTGIVKVYEKYSEEFGRNMIHVVPVDRLNLIIDPAARCLQDVPLIERLIMTRDEVDEYDWKDKKEIQYSSESVPATVIYERWGKIPLSLITKKESDNDKWIEGTIICSGGVDESQQGKTSTKDFVPRVVHKVIKNTKGVKPYEECWFRRVPNRWDGRGIPEMLKGLQSWLNTVVNVKRNNALIFQNGVFKIKKGTGITRQMIEKLSAGGAIPVDNMDDIQELRTGDLKPSVYREEIDIMSMADRTVGAFEIGRGETLPSSMPATTAVLQDKGQRSTFSLVQENIGLFLERLFNRHIIPSVVKSLKEGEVLRITGQLEDLDKIDEEAINTILNEEIAKYKERTGTNPSWQDIQRYKQKAAKNLKKYGKDRFVNITKHVFDTEYDVEVFISDERFDKMTIAKNLTDLLFAYARIPGVTLPVNEIMKEVLDLMGLSPTRFNFEQKVGMGTPGQALPRNETPNAQNMFERANLEGILSPRETKVM